MRVARPIPFAGAAFAVLHRTREFILKVYASLSLSLSLFADGISWRNHLYASKRENSTSIFIYELSLSYFY